MSSAEEKITASLPRLVLASTSPARRALLSATGIPYEAKASPFDEATISPNEKSPVEVAAARAYGKANALIATENNAIILGADQVLALDKRIFGKPQNKEDARQMLQILSGQTHWLHTGVCLLWKEKNWEKSFVESTRLQIRSLRAEEIETYLSTEEWKGCAGAYRIEGRGVCLFESIEGDYFTVVGLPVLRVLSTLHALGFPLFLSHQVAPSKDGLQ